MMNRNTSIARRLALGLALATCAIGTAHAVDFSGAAAITTDYVWRGTSQSNEDPAVQASFKVASDTGFYAQAWGSSVEFAPDTRASTEVDLVAGWSGALSDTLALDVNLTHYLYPSTTVDLDWTEAIATLTWLEHYWVQVGHSNDALATDTSGTYATIGARLPVSDTFRFEAAAGHYWLAGNSGYEDYAHLQVGAVWAFASPLELRLTAHETDSAAERGFGALAGSRIEAALQASF